MSDPMPQGAARHSRLRVAPRRTLSPEKPLALTSVAQDATHKHETQRMKVGLFIPVTSMPKVTAKWGAAACAPPRVGCDVDYPLDQTCCGRPITNAGIRARRQGARRNACTVPNGMTTSWGPGQRGLRPRRLPALCSTTTAAYLSLDPAFEISANSSTTGETQRPLSPGLPRTARVSLHTCHGVRLIARRRANSMSYSKLRDLLRHGRGIESQAERRDESACEIRRHVLRRGDAVSVAMGRAKVAPPPAAGAVHHRGRLLLPDAHAGDHRPGSRSRPYTSVQFSIHTHEPFESRKRFVADAERMAHDRQSAVRRTQSAIG